MHGFPPSTFQRRRSAALHRLGKGVMVLPSAGRVYRAGDSELPYRPDSELFYLTGWTEPDAVLVLRGFADDARVVLYVAPRDPAAEQWTGIRMGPGAAAERLGLPPADVRPLERLSSELPGLLTGADLVHARLGEAHGVGEDVGSVVVRSTVASLALARRRGARTGSGPRGIVDPGGILDELRLFKDAEEVRAMRAAADASVAGFEALFDRVVAGIDGEAEAEAELLRAFRRAGASGPAYAPITAAGVNACILHYGANDAPILEGDLLLVDAGAEVRMYAGDISRTIPVSGRFSTRQRELYEVVEAARASAVEACRPGRTVEAVHEAASLALVRGLVDLGVLSGDPAVLLAEEALRPFFPHRTSHWLGLETHDPGDYAREGRARLLEPGMVLTVEPGLYLPPPGLFQGLDLPDPDPAAPFRGLGIRIEDDILITDDGPENLTAALPTDPDALEARLTG
ncbi:MAG: M24 family metallopeptidase [Gemmatimonadales bacterium]|nr:MAG: M24 family metallopeptidase [Gemmatimonadales bacterium]